MIEDNKNKAYVFYNQEVVYFREKVKLFGYEKKYFKKGEIEPEIFEIDGIKYAILICFEIRFIDYWVRLKGVDVVLIPAMWGVDRKSHLLTLSNALALSLQSYVVVSDGLAFGSGIVSPWGEEIRSEEEIINVDIDFNYVKKIRKKFLLK
jgi:predicted amidohydrolase